MTDCPACAAECADGTRFCAQCGAPLAVPRIATTERRLVTTLFCDLVDFTGLCEGTDPEDVDRFLRDYYAVARRIIGLYGGAVEKFVGDAVVGVFGLPLTHEDDAERAVRAAVRLTEEVPDIASPHGTQRLVRVGVDTGTAVVRLDVEPGSGEGVLTGDAVVTASRLQMKAPPGSVVVGEATHSMAASVALFVALPSIHLQGKTTATQPWLVKGGLARLGVELRRPFTTPLIGREVERGVLTGLFEKAAASSTPQCAFIVGEAGIGKSRLIVELARALDERPGMLIQWRQARCPAFGEGLGLWPLAQIVRQHAGIQVGDDGDATDAKLQRALGDEPERSWLADRLRPLLGLPSPPAPQDENFAAWLRFLEMACRQRPTVLVFEDVHWASEIMLAFMAHVVRNVGDVPLLFIATSRPELLAAHPDYQFARAVDARIARLVQLDLHPLSRSESERLVSALTQAQAVSEIQTTIVDRAGGNPLYAEELVHLLDERVADAADDHALNEAARRELPASLQSLIAARLDSLPATLTDLLANASVIGEVFWSGALAAVSGRTRSDVAEALVALLDREFVRRLPVSSISGDEQFIFWHALTRDVAYARLTRGARARRHKSAAEWIGGSGDLRAADHAEILAHHYATALDLAEAIGEVELAASLREPTAAALALVGDHAMRLNVEAGEAYYDRAVCLTPTEHPDRPVRLSGWADALMQSGRLVEAEAAYRTAIEGLVALGDRRRAAAAIAQLAQVLEWRGNSGALATAREAVDLLRGEAPSRELIAVTERWVATNAVTGDSGEAIASADRVLDLCRQMGLPESLPALHYRAVARCEVGDAGGLDDFERAITIARERGADADIRAIHFNMAEALCLTHGPAAAVATSREGVGSAERRRDRGMTAILRAGLLHHLFLAGEWGEVLSVVDDVATELEQEDAAVDLESVLALRTLLLEERRRGVAEEVSARLTARHAGRPPSRTQAACLAWSAAVCASRGEPAEARRLLWVCEEATRECRSTFALVIALPQALRTASALGDTALVDALTTGLPDARMFDAQILLLKDGLLHEQGDRRAAAAFGAAADGWASLGVPFERAQAQMARGRCLLACDDAAAARAALTAAAAGFTQLEASASLAETHEILARVPHA